MKQSSARISTRTSAFGGASSARPGAEGEIYDVVIKCVDFSAPGRSEDDLPTQRPHQLGRRDSPRLRQRDARRIVRAASPAARRSMDPAIEANWKKNPNLVVGGDFQSGSGGVPRGWEPVAGQNREPLGNLVRWVSENGQALEPG